VAGSIGDYIPTGAAANSAPRFDFDPVTHAPLALLMEESRANIITNSRAINSWPTKTDTTVTDNSTTSPDGTVNASICTEGVAGTAQVVSNIPTVTAGSALSYTLFLKRGNTDYVRVLCVDTAATNGAQFWVNLATGVISGEANRGTATNRTVTITPLPNSWFRVVCQITMPGTSTTTEILVNSASASGSTTRVNNATYYLWGGQVEVASFPTSYIPTGAAAVTRPVDGASMPTGAWWLTQMGTLVADAYVPIQQSRAAELCGWHNGATTKTSINIGGGNTINMFDSAGLNTGLGAQPIVPFRAGYAYQNGVQRGCVNGGAITTATQATLTTGETALGIGCDSVIGLQPDGYIRRIRYWPVPLSAVQLQKVTK